ncbi:dihydrodipicolinate synthase family protein [Sediminibacillus terrae]|uniref:dihydrodipicolinate synthase family protein n=1 Tax=Sediminibacillus terrae TaxID=1562106 RepID=UPI0012970232|nr:dihydrodipicolinate synthase family protein [Sediminibacillus terrae]
MSIELILPAKDRKLYTYQMKGYSPFSVPSGNSFSSRTAFSAAHVVADPLADADPVFDASVDWNATLAYRHHLWSLGLAVAEAMDTAQRGMGLNWDNAKQLIRRSAKEAKAVGGRIASGAGTDQLAPRLSVTLDEVENAYLEQCAFIEGEGSQIILMASRALAACAAGPDDYRHVYNRLLENVSEPVILHWLGHMFDPALKGYWGHESIDEAMDVCLAIIQDNESKVDGIKVSLLDAEREIQMRRLLPDSVRMYTGDDFHYPDLIKGDGQGYSHALLGIFDAIAPAAAAALHALDEGDEVTYDAIFEKTVPLARHIFQKPTFSYKTGVVFMAYLNGHQTHFRLLGGKESARSITHLADLFILADQAGLLESPELAAFRMKLMLEQAGIAQGGRG